MKPTTHFRFVARETPKVGAAPPMKIRVLQQWYAAEGWEHEDTVAIGGRWEDVPLARETPEGPDHA